MLPLTASLRRQKWVPKLFSVPGVLKLWLSIITVPGVVFGNIRFEEVNNSVFCKQLIQFTTKNSLFFKMRRSYARRGIYAFYQSTNI